MDPTTNIQIVRHGYEADRREDANGAVEHFDSNVEWHWWGRTLHGRSEVKEMLESLYPLAETHNEIEHIAATTRYVLVKRVFSLQWKPAAMVSGVGSSPRGGRGFDLWTLDRKRIVRYHAFGRRRQVVRTVGLLDAIRLHKALR